MSKLSIIIMSVRRSCNLDCEDLHLSERLNTMAADLIVKADEIGKLR